MVAPVEIKVSAKVEGGDSVVDLTTDIDKLGKEAIDTGATSGKAAIGIEEIGKSSAEASGKIKPLESSLVGVGNKFEQAGKDASVAAEKIDKVGQESQQTSAQVTVAGDKIKAAGTKAKAAADDVDKVGVSATGAASALGNMASALLAAVSVDRFVQTAASIEQLEAGLVAVSQDAKVAGEQMDFVRRMAGAAGVDVVAAGQAFLGLAASTKGTAVEGKMAADVFEAVTVSMAKAGKSSADTQNALLALSQIASKGVVSMEELRGQLGEALPGALQSAASGLGVTTVDLIKLVESGKVAAEDIFPALTKGLNELYGTAPAAQTLSQEIANLKNAFTDMASRIGEAGVLDALKVGAESAQTAMVFLGESFTVVGQQIGVMAAAVTNLDFSGVAQAMRDIEEASRTNLLRAAEHNTVLRAALKGMGDEAINAALAAKEAGNKAQASGAQAEASAGGWVAMSLAYTNANKAIAETIAASTKEIELIKATGQAAIERARLSGEEVLVRQATQQAATEEADAVQKLAELRLREVSGLESELASKRNMLAENGKISETRRKEVEDLEKLITVKKIEAQTTDAQAAALRSKTQANSDEAIAATAALKAVEANKISRIADEQATLSGLVAQKELAKQVESIAALMGNETEARKAKIKQVELEIQITNAKVAVAKAEAEGSIAVAKAKLAEMEATKQIDQVKKAELEASIKIAQAKVVEAEALGKSTTLLQKQIDALIAGGGHMGNYGKETNAATAAVNAQSDALELLNTQYKLSSDYSDRQIALLNKELDARQAVLDLKQREIDLENRRRGVDKEGYGLNTAGQRAVGSAMSLNEAVKQAVAQGLSEEEAITIAKRNYEPGGRKLFGTTSIDVAGGVYGNTFWEGVNEALDQRLLNKGIGDQQAAAQKAQNSQQSSGQKAQQPTQSQPAKVYEVRINGQTYTAKTDQAAQDLIKLLEQSKAAT